LQKGYGAKTSDALVEIFLNNILSGTLTFVKNIGGNWIYKVMEKTERRYASWRLWWQRLLIVLLSLKIWLLHLVNILQQRICGELFLKNGI
jgi:hypothetical protein